VKNPSTTLKELTAEAEKSTSAVNFSDLFTRALPTVINRRMVEQGIGQGLLPELTAPNHYNFLSNDFFL
jgi:hypothetical protein